MKIPRIAYCSPINPAPTGISDYSEELLPYLGQYADLTLYLEEGLKPSNPFLSQSLELRSLNRLPSDQKQRPFDAILYHMGNSPAHAGIWRTAQQVPGVVVLHDFVLHHFILWYAANVHHNVQSYVQEMKERYGEAGNHTAQLMIRGRFTNSAFDFPCCESVVAAAKALIVHSQYVQRQISSMRPDIPNAVIPMGVPLSPLLDRHLAREILDLPQDALVLASFGHINAYKRLDPTLRAIAQLQANWPNLRYILVGSVSPNYDAKGLIARMGLEKVVQMTGYVTRPVFESYIAAADICLNLRHPTAGETSASLLRLLGAGCPTLVSATGAFTELPPNVAAQVDLDATESELIATYCDVLTKYPSLAKELGKQARNYVAQNHNLDQAALGYIRFLAQVYRWDKITRFRPEPLWSLEETFLPLPFKQKEVHGKELCFSPFIPSIAQALVDLGVTEKDELILQTIAQRLADFQ